MSQLPVLVIGGGVAGSACALRLRNRGVDVHVAEKASFPRSKVCGCCIGGAGLETLEQLSLRQWVLQAGLPTDRWHASIGGRLVQLALPGGVAISREVLDTRLLSSVREAGATVSMPCQAMIDSIEDDCVVSNLRLGGAKQGQRFSAVVVATGLNARGLQTLLPWKERPNGPFGVSLTARSASIEPGVIYMACDDDGYVGVVRLPDGRVDIAAALASGSTAASTGTPQERVDAILARSEFGSWSFSDRSPLMTTPPLRRSRTAGIGRVLAIGDAAGYVEPFTGEGMTWGMQSGIAAADTIASSMPDLSTVGKTWDRRHGVLLRNKKLACRAVTGVLRSPLARRAVAHALASWPSLATPLIRSLNRRW